MKIVAKKFRSASSADFGSACSLNRLGKLTEPQAGKLARQKQKPSDPGKSENEGIQRIPSRTRETGWPHPSL